MESIIRNVRDIDTGERRVLEHVLGRQLRDNQKVIIQIVTPTAEPEKLEHVETVRPPLLPDRCNVFAGLGGNEITEVESVILRRSDLSRSFE